MSCPEQSGVKKIVLIRDKDIEYDFPFQALDYKIQEIYKKVDSDATIEFTDISEPNFTYETANGKNSNLIYDDTIEFTLFDLSNSTQEKLETIRKSDEGWQALISFTNGNKRLVKDPLFLDDTIDFNANDSHYYRVKMSHNVPTENRWIDAGTHNVMHLPGFSKYGEFTTMPDITGVKRISCRLALYNLSPGNFTSLISIRNGSGTDFLHLAMSPTDLYVTADGIAGKSLRHLYSTLSTNTIYNIDIIKSASLIQQFIVNNTGGISASGLSLPDANDKFIGKKGTGSFANNAAIWNIAFYSWNGSNWIMTNRWDGMGTTNSDWTDNLGGNNVIINNSPDAKQIVTSDTLLLRNSRNLTPA
jgi:hypothetical protein